MNLPSEGGYAGNWAYTETPVLGGEGVMIVVSGPNAWHTQTVSADKLPALKKQILRLGVDQEEA